MENDRSFTALFLPVGKDARWIQLDAGRTQQFALLGQDRVLGVQIDTLTPEQEDYLNKSAI